MALSKTPYIGNAPKTVPCTVREVKRMTAKSVVVTLDPGPNLPRFRHDPGQRLTFCLNVNEAPCFRSYNLVNPVGKFPQIAVKQVTDGGASQMFNEQVQPGDVLQVMPPSGHLYERQLDYAARHIMLFAAGSGITPMISIAHHALTARPDHRVTLVYANSTPRDIMMQHELERMAKSSRFEVFHVLGDGATGEDLSTGRLDHAKLNRLLEQYHISGLPHIAFLSGPKGFMDLVEEVAGAHHAPISTRRYSFMEQPFLHLEDRSATQRTSEVCVTLNGVTKVIDNVSRSMTILEAADDAGLAMTANCRSGICHRCKAKLIAGQTVQQTQTAPARPVEAGWILCCQQRPSSGRVEIEMG